MSKIKWFLHLLTGVSFKKYFRCVDQVHEKCGKNRVVTFFDMLLCIPLYGAGYHDYLIFGFYNMKHKNRKTFVTRMKNKRLILRMNDQNYSHVFENKGEFDRRFEKFLHREWLDVNGMTEQAFSDFMQDKEVIFAKPYSGESGKGIERLEKKNFDSLKAMYQYVTGGKFGLIEELIVQHPALSHMYPGAINTYRVVTIVVDGTPHCVYATAKFGGGGKFVDNLENGGICCPIDIETGKICGCAHTSKLENYDCHPDTGVPGMGYQLPFVKEAVALCKEAALVVEEMKYIGWDVFITEDGPGIIEGNDYPGYDFWQLPEHTPDQIGLWPYYQRLIPDLK